MSPSVPARARRAPARRPTTAAAATITHTLVATPKSASGAHPAPHSMISETPTTIGDTAFLRSMIPHHSGAILMCREASIHDPEIKTLCGEIVEGQRREIDQMKAILSRL